MSFSCGIVGLPNVGKSTLFNAITRTSLAYAANFPFCTIEPNTGLVEIDDSRLRALAKIASSEKIIFNQLKVVDIAGLVRGASKGEGLGNKFLGHIREVNVILHVLRCFEDDDIKHVNNTIDPLEDAALVEMELVLADLESIKKKIEKLKKSEAKMKARLEDLAKALEAQESALEDRFSEELAELNLMSTKPVIYICNVEEGKADTGNELSGAIAAMAKERGRVAVIVSAKIEDEISKLDAEEDRVMFLHDIGLNISGLNQIAKVGYDTLGLITFFTIGPKEARAWPLKNGFQAPKAAGVIHSDFEKGFIRAEVISTEDYLAYGGGVACKQNGKMRVEGRDYQVKDGDIMHFRFTN